MTWLKPVGANETQLPVEAGVNDGSIVSPTRRTGSRTGLPASRSQLLSGSAKTIHPVKAPPEQVAAARPVVADAKAGKEVEFFTQVTAYKTLVLDLLWHGPPPSAAGDAISWGRSRVWAGVGSHLPAEVQVIALGQDVAIVCLPGEVFVDLGLAIKRASPFRTTLVIELCNCVETIYIPTRVAYAGGSYEVTNAATQPGTGELLAETAVRLLRDAAAD